MTNNSLIRHPTRRQFFQGIAAGIPVIALSGCGWTLANVKPQPTSQTSSNELYIYTWAGYTDRNFIERFRKKTGITVVADVYDSNEAMLAKLQAGGGGGYSILYPSDYMVQKMMDLGMLVELDRSRIVGMDNLFTKFQNPTYNPHNSHSIPLSWGTTGLIYNKKKVQPAPTDWSYLWEYKDQLSRRMTLLNDVREVMGATLKMLGYSYNTKNTQEIEAAYKKLLELKPNLASFTSDAWRTQILSGDLLIAMCYSSDANEVMPENQDLEYVLPKSGSSLWVDTLVIPTTAPNIDGAYAWINFMLQPDVAAEICKELSFAVPNKEAVKLLPPEIKENLSLFPRESALEKCEGIAPAGKMEEVFERYWTQLTSK